MDWIQLGESIATIGIFLFAILIGFRDRPATVNVLEDKFGMRQLVVMTKKGKVFRQYDGPRLPAEVEGSFGQWDLMHSLPRKKGLKARLFGEFDRG